MSNFRNDHSVVQEKNSSEEISMLNKCHGFPVHNTSFITFLNNFFPKNKNKKTLFFNFSVSLEMKQHQLTQNRKAPFTTNIYSALKLNLYSSCLLGWSLWASKSHNSHISFCLKFFFVYGWLKTFRFTNYKLWVFRQISSQVVKSSHPMMDVCRRQRKEDLGYWKTLFQQKSNNLQVNLEI
jgi:hypothetical protein